MREDLKIRVGLQLGGAWDTFGAGSRWLWVLLLLVATGLRLPAPDWDGGIAAHPDERYLLGAAAETPFLGNVCAAMPDFPYGHLPVGVAQLLVLAAPDADPLYAARLLSGLVGVAVVIVAGACGRQIAGRTGGLLAAAMAAFSPFLIQQARFYTVDPLGTLLVSGAVLAACRKHWRAAGICLGLAVACKVSLVLATLPTAAAAMGLHRETSRAARLRVAHILVAAALGFFFAAPWSVLSPIACWRGPAIQSLMASGRYLFPYTRQYAGTWPYAYPLMQMGLWGLGPLVTALGTLGLGLGAARTRTLSSLLRRPAWCWPCLYFLTVAALSVKFPRYMLPLYPWWAAWAAYAAVRVGRRAPRCLAHGLAALCLVSTAILGLAQAGLYGVAHPWIMASEWIGSHLPAGATVGVEVWDHPLPVPLETVSPAVYRQVALPTLDEESADKVSELAALSAEVPTIVLASRRGYGAMAQQPVENRATLAWYRALFEVRDKRLFVRCPRLGPLAITDDPLSDAGLPVPDGLTLAERCGTPYALRLPRLDESFRVYDAPTVVVLTTRR